MSNAIDNQLQMSALEATADGVVITDVDGFVLWVNPAYSKMTGYSLDEVEGKHTRILKSGRQDRDFYEQLWTTILSGEVWHGELWNKRKDESVYLEEQSITPVLDDAGGISNFVAIKRDITTRYEWQQQLEHAERMEAIGQLTAGIAHNFNNKLTTIMGYNDLLREEIVKYKDEVLDDYTQEVKVATDDARDLVKQLISFSREDVSDSKPLHLDTVINESLKPLSSKLPSDISLKVELDSDLPTVNHEQVKIYQMLMTLVINARDATKSTGYITIGLRHAHIDNDVCTSCHESIAGEFVELYVLDMGEGIVVEDMERIFLPFFTTKEMSGGTGMGLSVLHGLMHEHGGHVVVKTQPGMGSIFRLLFPISEVVTEN